MISQLKASRVLIGDSYRPDHAGRLMKLFNLTKYKSISEGTLFYGCYKYEDYKIIISHKGPTVVMWGGSDITAAKRYRFKFPERVRHIALTSQNQRELECIGIRSDVRYISFLNPDKFQLTPLGPHIYCYVPWRRDKFYGIEIIIKIAKQLPQYKFILTRYAPKPKPLSNCITYPLVNEEQLLQLYRSSFCSIRPTKHDGFPQSIVELGLMGRPTAWIYGCDYATKCNTVNDYVKFIIESDKKEPDSVLRDKLLKMIEGSSKILDGY